MHCRLPLFVYYQLMHMFITVKIVILAGAESVVSRSVGVQEIPPLYEEIILQYHHNQTYTSVHTSTQSSIHSWKYDIKSNQPRYYFSARIIVCGGGGGGERTEERDTCCT